MPIGGPPEGDEGVQGDIESGAGTATAGRLLDDGKREIRPPGGRRRGLKKRNVYLTADVAEELAEECLRLDRSPTWLIERAWTLARTRLMENVGGNVALSPTKGRHSRYGGRR